MLFTSSIFLIPTPSPSYTSSQNLKMSILHSRYKRLSCIFVFKLKKRKLFFFFSLFEFDKNAIFFNGFVAFCTELMCIRLELMIYYAKTKYWTGFKHSKFLISNEKIAFTGIINSQRFTMWQHIVCGNKVFPLNLRV